MALGSQGGLSTPNASEASQFVVKDFNFAADKKSASDLASEDGLTHTRASLAYYNNSSGNLVSVTSNEPVYEYSQGGTSLGMRIEPATTNKIKNTALDSDEISSSGTAWLRPGAEATIALGDESNITSPDGASNGVSFTGSASSGSGHWHLMYDAGTIAGSATLNGWSASVYAKAGNAKYIGMAFSNSAKIGAAFRLATDGYDAPGIVNSNNCTASMEDVGDGWYRCKVENITNSAAWSLFAIKVASTAALIWDDSGLGSWTQGSDYPSSTANYIYLFGPQLEGSTVCTSYMANPSELSAGVARAETVVSATSSNSPNFASFYNQSAGTFAIEGSRNIAGSTDRPTILEVNTGGEGEDALGFDVNATKECMAVHSDGSQVALLEAGDDVAKNTAFKISGAYASGNYGACLNGGTVVTNSLSGVPTVDQLHFGQSEWNTNRKYNGHIKRVRYWRRRVPDAYLKKIST